MLHTNIFNLTCALMNYYLDYYYYYVPAPEYTTNERIVAVLNKIEDISTSVRILN